MTTKKRESTAVPAGKAAGRRKFLKTAGIAAGAGAASVAFPNVSRAQTVTFKFQSTWPAKDIFHEYAADYVTRVNEMAGGRLKLDLLNRENVAGGHLEGTWKPCAAAEVLLHEAGDGFARIEGGLPAKEFSFRYDRDALPQEVLDGLAGKSKVAFTIYAIGVMTWRENEHPFLLAAIHGFLVAACQCA